LIQGGLRWQFPRRIFIDILEQNSLKSVDSGLSTTGIDGCYAEAISSVAVDEVNVAAFAILELFDQENPTWTFKLAT
jgi:hypothetical protein